MATRQTLPVLPLRGTVIFPGITAPIVPGIQPIHSFKQIASFASRCGTSIPAWLAERFPSAPDLDPDQSAHLVPVPTGAG